MPEPLGVGLIGCGTVGSGVAKIMLEHSMRLEQHAGRPLVLRKVVIRNRSKPKPVDVPPALIVDDYLKVLNDPTIDTVCELIGGTTTSRQIVLEAFAAGKNVVTANKALLAAHGQELFDAARKSNRVICFEAAVAGGVPIIRTLAESFTANQITSIQAILNGTSNFILSSMADRGVSYDEALKEAQRLGYAEADPTLDVDGSDAAHKLAILAQLAFGVNPKPHEIERVGIDRIDALDMKFASELGYTIKLLAEAWVDGKQVALHVAPVMVRKTDMLGQVRGAHNAIQVVGDVVGETLYQGPGAGMLPTASSVVADLIDIAVGRAQKTFTSTNLWSTVGRGFTVEPSERVRSRFYLRLMAFDQPGALADVCRVLADQRISISSVIQHEAKEGDPNQLVPLVIVTHYAETGKFRAALKAISQLSCIRVPAVSYSVDD